MKQSIPKMIDWFESEFFKRLKLNLILIYRYEWSRCDSMRTNRGWLPWQRPATPTSSYRSKWMIAILCTSNSVQFNSSSIVYSIFFNFFFSNKKKLGFLVVAFCGVFRFMEDLPLLHNKAALIVFMISMSLGVAYLSYLPRSVTSVYFMVFIDYRFKKFGH